MKLAFNYTNLWPSFWVTIFHCADLTRGRDHVTRTFGTATRRRTR